MGSNENEATSKPAKASPPQQEQVAVHPYPDWSAMQAYYGPGVAIPPPYFTSAVVPGHAHHPYMWGPQPVMAPFGTPYPAIYAHGGYSHPSLTLASHTRIQGNTSLSTSEAVTAPQDTETSAKHLTNSKDCGLMKKLKGFEGLAVSTSNGNEENKGGSVNGQSQSEEDLDGSSDRSEYNSQGSQSLKKRSLCADTPSKGKKCKEGHQLSAEDVTTISLGVAVGHPSVPPGKSVVVPPPAGRLGIDIGATASIANSKTVATPLSSTAIVPIRNTVTSEHWMQDEREIKRERRKQSNRESARRSRLRKQAETEELALKVETLASENATLQMEITRLSELSEKLRLENSSLMEKLKLLEGGESGMTLGETDSKNLSPVGIENLLSKLGNSNSSDVNGQQEPEVHENSSAKKLHQLLEPSPRTDTVTAS